MATIATATVISIFCTTAGRFETGDSTRGFRTAPVGDTSEPFDGTDNENGRLLNVRFARSVLTPASAAWVTAMLLDDGGTWEEKREMLLMGNTAC
ncbi:MAG: hypothetical protein AB7V46_12055 [Thermomicrobiales bacterium]